MAQFDMRLIPNIAIAFATVGVFLFAVVFSLYNAESLINMVETQEPETALIIGGIGGTIITALLMNVRDIYQFFFRKAPKTN